MVLAAGAAALLRPAPFSASQTQFWQVGAFDEFIHGTLHDVSLNQEGSLQLAPPVVAYFDPEQSLALSLAAGGDGRFYVGTGHQGKVFRVDAEGQGKMLFQAPEPEILAIVCGPNGDIYAASSPEGKIYRITPEGKSSVFFDPKQKYIWSLVFDAHGNLYAGTGDTGKIYEIDADGKGRVFYDSRQTHVICLLMDVKGDLIAGSDPNGLVFRISPEGKGFVIYKADFPEVHALALGPDGGIYAAALGGSGATPTSPFFVPPVTAQPQPTSVTTVTVTAAGGNAGAEGEEKQQTPTPEPSPPRPPSISEQHVSPSFNRAPAPSFSPPSTQPGRGELVRISPDNSVETLWTSDRESIFGLTLEGRNVLFSTDGSGRIFRLSPSADGPLLTLMTETREAQATRLLVDGTNVYVATSNVAKLFRLSGGAAPEGSYESPVKDTKFVSRWGILSWRSQVPAGTSLELYTRAGNSEQPDATWSDWSGPYSNADGTQVASPSARYIQWKAVFKGRGGTTPKLDDVTLAYLNENLPPEIHALDVNGSGGSLASGVPNISVGNGGTNFGSVATQGDHKTTITWQADDPNGDRLAYSLYLKASDETDWHLVKSRLHESNYSLDSTALPDGEYVARLVASDEESNSPGQARRSELVSAPFWIVNTPPRIEVVSQQVRGGAAEIHFRATTEISPLRSAEVSIDGAPWKPVAADDGIIDSRSETFTVTLPQVAPGEHEVLLRSDDIAGNTGIGRAVIRTD